MVFAVFSVLNNAIGIHVFINTFSGFPRAGEPFFKKSVKKEGFFGRALRSGVVPPPDRAVRPFRAPLKLRPLGAPPSMSFTQDRLAARGSSRVSINP